MPPKTGTLYELNTGYTGRPGSEPEVPIEKAAHPQLAPAPVDLLVTEAETSATTPESQRSNAVEEVWFEDGQDDIVLGRRINDSRDLGEWLRNEAPDLDSLEMMFEGADGDELYVQDQKVYSRDLGRSNGKPVVVQTISRKEELLQFMAPLGGDNYRMPSAIVVDKGIFRRNLDYSDDPRKSRKYGGHSPWDKMDAYFEISETPLRPPKVKAETPAPTETAVDPLEWLLQLPETDKEAVQAALVTVPAGETPSFRKPQPTTPPQPEALAPTSANTLLEEEDNGRTADELRAEFMARVALNDEAYKRTWRGRAERIAQALRYGWRRR